MKLRWKMTVGIAALITLGSLLALSGPNSARQALERTRRSLREQGLKTEVKEFNLATSPEDAKRAALIASTTWAAATNRSRPLLQVPFPVRSLIPAGPDAALVLWNLERPRSGLAADSWLALRESLGTNREKLELARQAVVSGPIRFEPIGAGKPSALLPYLAELRPLVLAFSASTMLALRDQNPEFAWTNLLACTGLVTSYEPEPIEVSHLVRFTLAGPVYEATWNALQSSTWTEAQLAELQRRWEAADFWRGLPETAAYSRAVLAACFEGERHDQLTLEYVPRRPRDFWSLLMSYGPRLSYWSRGGYENENYLLRYYADQELEIRRALQAKSWLEMSQVPGVTNRAPFLPPHSSRVTALMSTRLLATAFQGQGRGLLARAAEAEARRRLLITALALERWRLRHGSYPASVEELAPEFLKTPPVDFMDGKPIRFRLTPDKHFVLYSVGLDCADDGGMIQQPGRQSDPFDPVRELGPQNGTDLVWPRPASAEEVEQFLTSERNSKAVQKERLADVEANEQWRHTSFRQSKVEDILQRTNSPTEDQSFRGRSLVDLLTDAGASGTNRPALADLLALKQKLTGGEPEVVTFELPVKYDRLLTNFLNIELLVDPVEDEESDEGCVALQAECLRGTNGNCLLAWHTIYESPGKHALMACLERAERQPPLTFTGPLLAYTISNLCQFSVSSGYFDHDLGGTFRVRIPEPNGSLGLEIKTPAGTHVRFIEGSTSNGVVTAHWDLTDDQGRRCTNDSYDTLVHVVLRDSGRAQTLKGP